MNKNWGVCVLLTHAEGKSKEDWEALALATRGWWDATQPEEQTQGDYGGQELALEGLNTDILQIRNNSVILVQWNLVIKRLDI